MEANRMKLLTRVLPLTLALLWLGVQGLGAQTPFVPPWAPNLSPQWAPIPQVPGVYYVPDQSHNLFRHGNRFYVYQAGQWHRANHLNGPWSVIQQPPQVFYNIGPTYFTSPPGWAKGKKTGWRGQPLPPGQMKKLNQGGSLPPGQMKKLE
jgi:hypothetical protein